MGVLLFGLWLVMITMLIGLFAWIYVSNSHYSFVLLKPGHNYTVGGRKYTFPNLESTGPVYLLKDEHIEELRELLRRTSGLLEEFKIQWWLTGGSLIGAERHGAIPMPFDDDIDIGVCDSNREFLYGEDFGNVAARSHNLQVIYLKGSSSKKANATGASVRLQLPGKFATLDIFFWRTVDNNTRVIKLDGWSSKDSVIFNQKEQFNYCDVFPIKAKKIDEINVFVANNPQALLEQQYGKTVMTKIFARSAAVSHLFPFMVLRNMWTTSSPG